MERRTDIDQITRDVIDVAIRIHRDLGPGLLESVYEMLLASKLAGMGYSVARQHPIDIEYEGSRFDAAFRIDLLVDRRLIVEIKSVEQLAKVHAKQVLTHLRLTNQPVGLLINFRRRNAEGGRTPSRQQLRSLCVLCASARKMIGVE